MTATAAGLRALFSCALAATALLFFTLAAANAASAEGAPAEEFARPQRVVSMNVCTDQLAMMLARPGQLVSVSWLAGDPQSSAMAEEAAGYRPNRGQAEEIFLMKPDLVLAGTFSTRSTVELLRRLGFRVEEFAPAASFDDIRDQVTRMAGLLGNREKGEETVADFDRSLEAIAAALQPGDRTTAGKRLTIALQEVNSYTSGSGTLADEVINAAGLSNLASELGYAGSARLPLEVLIAASPDLVAGTARNYGAPALAESNFDHPAFRAIAAGGPALRLDSRVWACGTPHVIRAVEVLAASVGKLRGGRKAND